MRAFALFLLCTLVSCLDLSPKYDIAGPYFVETDAGATYKTLYYDLGNGGAIGRVMDIKRVGHTDKFIIVEDQKGYYFIDREKDSKYFNGEDIRGDLRSKAYFINWLDSLKIQNFKFDYEIEK